MAISQGQVTKVDTSKLETASATLKQKIQKARTSYGNVMTIVKNTNRYWIGEAGEEHRNAFLEQQDDIDQILARLSEHPDDLMKIANIYVKVEDATDEIAKAPATQLIV